MTGILNTAGALAELRLIGDERRRMIARGTSPPGAVDRLAHLDCAIQIVFLASRVTYFEAPDPTKEEARQLGITLPETVYTPAQRS